MRSPIFFLVFVPALWMGCSKSDSQSGGTKAALTKEDLVARGRAVYSSACSACHHSNPAIDGSIGPAVQGSSRELIEARVMHATYPPGYKPKRASALMVALPQFKNDLDALFEFLNSN